MTATTGGILEKRQRAAWLTAGITPVLSVLGNAEHSTTHPCACLYHELFSVSRKPQETLASSLVI